MIVIKTNPSIQADEVRRTIVRGLRDGTLTLFEAYLLHCEAIRIDRIAYTQSAWGRQLSISGLLSIVMHSITAEAFGLPDAANTYEGWYVDDFPQLKEHQPHFLTAAFPGTTGWRNDSDFLLRLNTTRTEYDNLPDDEGPYPIEVFPFHFAAPELVLIGIPVDAFLNANRDVSDAVGDAIVELATTRWG